MFAITRTRLLICLLGLWAVPLPAAMVLDLNDFFFFPGDPVVVTLDGSMATIGEDPAFSPILLANDPGLGDPDVISAAAGKLLRFEYDFTETAGGDDEFGAFVLDGGTGASLGAPYEFFSQASASGTVTFDLSSVLVGTVLGLQFQLSALFGDTNFDSTVKISNLRIEEDSTVVPEPGTALLLLSGLGLAALGARRSRSAKRRLS